MPSRVDSRHGQSDWKENSTTYLVIGLSQACRAEAVQWRQALCDECPHVSRRRRRSCRRWRRARETNRICPCFSDNFLLFYLELVFWLAFCCTFFFFFLSIPTLAGSFPRHGSSLLACFPVQRVHDVIVIPSQIEFVRHWWLLRALFLPSWRFALVAACFLLRFLLLLPRNIRVGSFSSLPCSFFPNSSPFPYPICLSVARLLAPVALLEESLSLSAAYFVVCSPRNASVRAMMTS
ncbi:hypothetical protein HDK90DRAFT_177218 [Phyllosticta capitalensis]|uniref:Transmembrane protein n=1 Tax=Phyllosticta capitalensis TaxID=121624 RepID=A0ABR1YVL6_9PEZI